MHLGNELLTLPVAAGTGAVAVAGIAYASVSARDDLDERRVPLLGVLGAFVFAAQMVNFPVLPGTSGHFVGGALLAIVLGPHAAALAMAAIVIVQCFVFQDGGILALGANVVNMAIAGPYVAYGVYRLIVPREGACGRARFYGATFLAAMASVTAGAVLLPLEVAAAGVGRAPLSVFLGVMVGLHAVIGAAEGMITFAAVVALARMRPGLVPAAPSPGPDVKSGLPAKSGFPVKTAAVSVLGAALLLGGGVSLVASSAPDGLESAVERTRLVAGARAGPAAESADRAGEAAAILPGYNRPEERWYWTTVSGVLGALLALGIIAAAGRALRRRAACTTHR